MKHLKRSIALSCCFCLLMSFFSFCIQTRASASESQGETPSSVSSEIPSTISGVALFREHFGRIYSAPTEDSMILFEINLTKENFLVYSYDEEWTCILYHGLPGYMPSSFLTIEPDRSAPFSHTGLIELRYPSDILYPYPANSWAEPLYGIPVSTASEDASIQLLGINGSWAEVSVQDQTGYLPTSHLKFTAENYAVGNTTADPYVPLSEASSKMWDYFLEKGLSEEATAALIGNVYAESALNTMNLENSFEVSLGFTDLSYTNAVNSGAYSRNSFVHDGAGYGLCQWTSAYRKDQLYAMAATRRITIADLDLQMDIIWDELNSEHSYLLAYLQYPLSIRQASDIIMDFFMVPYLNNQFLRNMRLSYCLTFYEGYRE